MTPQIQQWKQLKVHEKNYFEASTVCEYALSGRIDSGIDLNETMDMNEPFNCRCYELSADQ